MLVLSAKGIKLFSPELIFKISINLLTGTDSPVKVDSSVFILYASINLQSAGTKSPASRTITSPLTKSSLFTTIVFPSLITLDVAAVIFFKESIAFSAFPS